MSKFSQDFSNSHLRPQYKKIDGQIVEVGKVDLQELYNSMLPSSLDAILKAFLEPCSVEAVDTDVVPEFSRRDSFEEVADIVDKYALDNGLDDMSFSDVLLHMINSTVEPVPSESPSATSDNGGNSND